MLRGFKKWWRLVRHGECPRCRGTTWRDEGGMGADWAECARCGFRRGYDSYMDRVGKVDAYEEAAIKDWLDHGYPGMPS